MPGLVAARGVADAGGAATEQDEGAVAVLLEQAEDHDADQVADVEAVRGAIEADIGRDRTGLHRGAQGLGVGTLKDEAARGRFVEERVGRHGG